MQKKEYDIIKMVQHGKYCERILDTVTGQTLICWLKYHPQIEKEALWALMRNLLLQIAWFHKHGEKQTYGYFTPYSVIVKESGEVYLLDLEAEGSREMVRQIQSRTVRKYFVNPEIYRQRGICEAADIYGFGRTIQYILSQSEPDPPLTKKEEYQLTKFIQNCLETDGEKGYTDFSMVQKHFPKWRRRKARSRIEKKGSAGIFACALVVIGFCIFGESKEGQREEIDQMNEKMRIEKTAKESKSDENLVKRNADTVEEMVQEVLVQEKTVDGQILALKNFLKEYGREGEEEAAFLCLSQWYERTGQMDTAAEICRKGRKHLPQSEAIALRYLEMLWQVEGLEPEMKERATKKIIEELPKIQKQESFENLKRAYGF